jgi:CRISPR-associated protein Cas1
MGMKSTDGSWFQEISSPRMLQSGWDRVRINGGGPGQDGLTVSVFNRNASSRIIGISRKLRSGRYLPSPSRRVYIPKKSGGVRPLDIPGIEDRIIQASVALFLQPHFENEFEDSSFGYRPGLGVRDAVRKVAKYRREGFRYVVDADIRRYFENVSHERLIPKLEQIIDDQKLIDLIWTWLEWYAPSGRGLPQGSPLSPALANLFLDQVDEEIAGRGVRLVRYADDFVLLCKGEKTAEKALEDASRLLHQHSLELHQEKTKIVTFDQGFRFLGHVFVRSLVFQDTALDETPSEDAIESIQLALREDREAETTRLKTLDADPVGALSGTSAQDLSLSRRWRTLYVLEPGRRLSATGEAFTVMEGETRIIGLNAERVGRIEIGNSVLIDTIALDLAAAHNVPIVRLDGRGAPTGKWLSVGHDHGARQMAQFKTSASPDKSLSLAKKFTEARVHNQWVLLKRLDMKSKRPELADVSVKFRRIIRAVPHVDNVAILRGREGEAGKLFWRQYSLSLPQRWQFPTRSRKPASGITEVLLNLSVSLLARDVEVALLRAGLHTGIGFYHVERNSGDALVYDFMEEFRAPVAEACVAAAIGRNQVRVAMFNRDSKNGWGISREGYKAIVRAYETSMNRTLTDPVNKDRTTWRGLITQQAQRLALHCEGETEYTAYHMDY